MIKGSRREDLRCVCCDQGFREHDLAWCNTCGQPFHLALRIDVPVGDCGDAWIDEELEAVQFGCDRCLEARGMARRSR